MGFVSAATWTTNPDSCPAIFKSQQGLSGTKLCGYDGSAAYFYDMTSIVAPASTTTYISSSGGLRGGFGLNCEAKSGSEPFCLSSATCNYDTSCNSAGRLTQCTDWGTFACGECGPSRQSCDVYVTAPADDADGCEITTGSTSCDNGANNNMAASCSCVCDSGYQDCDASGEGFGSGCEVRTGITPHISGDPNTVFGTSCSEVCASGYQFCDGSFTDVNGCEVQTGVTSFGTANAHFGGSCSAVCDGGWMACEGDVAGVEGCNTQVNSACTTGDGKPGQWKSGCVCEETAPEHFITNILASGFGDFLVWGTQFNPLGWLMKLTNANNESIGIDNESCIVFKDGSKMCGAGNITLPGQNQSGALVDNSSIDARIGEYNSSIPYVDNNFLRKDGDNATGRYDFNGGWDSGGITFDLGDMFAQRLFVFNITSLAISHLNVNGSLLPDFDNFFDLGSSLFKWRNGYFSGDVRVDGEVYIGNDSVSTLISNSETFANNYTDTKVTTLNTTLTNYVDNAVLSSSGVGTIVGMTVATTTGNAISGSFIGYAAMNDLCDTEFSGSHLCSTGEVLATIANGNYSYFGYPWLSNGPPGFTSNSNDCNGWTDGTGNYLGPFWNWELNAQAGAAFLTPCSQIKSLMCCK
jgi:hypothetical protein